METLTIIAIFAGIGIVDTVYLMYKKAVRADVACIGFPKRWCTKVQYSTYSTTFGIPNAVSGFAMYLAILVLVVLQPSVPFWPVAVLVGIGAAFSLYFFAIQVFVLRALCTWCVISLISFAAMFWAVFLR